MRGRIVWLAFAVAPLEQSFIPLKRHLMWEFTAVVCWLKCVGIPWSPSWWMQPSTQYPWRWWLMRRMCSTKAHRILPAMGVRRVCPLPSRGCVMFWGGTTLHYAGLLRRTCGLMLALKRWTRPTSSRSLAAADGAQSIAQLLWSRRWKPGKLWSEVWLWLASSSTPKRLCLGTCWSWVNALDGINWMVWQCMWHSRHAPSGCLHRGLSLIGSRCEAPMVSSNWWAGSLNGGNLKTKFPTCPFRTSKVWLVTKLSDWWHSSILIHPLSTKKEYQLRMLTCDRDDISMAVVTFLIDRVAVCSILGIWPKRTGLDPFGIAL